MNRALVNQDRRLGIGYSANRIKHSGVEVACNRKVGIFKWRGEYNFFAAFAEEKADGIVCIMDTWDDIQKMKSQQWVEKLWADQMRTIGKITGRRTGRIAEKRNVQGRDPASRKDAHLNKVLLKIKRAADGTVERYKSRLESKRFYPTHGDILLWNVQSSNWSWYRVNRYSCFCNAGMEDAGFGIQVSVPKCQALRRHMAGAPGRRNSESLQFYLRAQTGRCGNELRKR